MIITKTMNNLNRKDSFIITLLFEHLIEVKIRDRHVLRKMSDSNFTKLKIASKIAASNRNTALFL
jgi:hypothetical protein